VRRGKSNEEANNLIDFQLLSNLSVNLDQILEMRTLRIKILEPQVLALLQSLEALNLIKISPQKLLTQTDEKSKLKPKHLELPITPAEEPDGDMMDLYGIWKGNPISLDELRHLAWGERI